MKYENICVKNKGTHWISGGTSNTLSFFIRSIDRLTDLIVKICQSVNRINFREFGRHLCYNTEEKHHFVPFKILNVMIIHTTYTMRRLQLRSGIPTKSEHADQPTN